MAISEDLFMAILSMDAYNRGYNAGIEDNTPGKDGQLDGLGRVGSLIGNAVVTADAQDVEGVAQAVGFYAVAYDWNGHTVISYRGTDNHDLRFWNDLPFEALCSYSPLTPPRIRSKIAILCAKVANGLFREEHSWARCAWLGEQCSG